MTVQQALDALTDCGLAESIRKPTGIIIYRLVWPIDGKTAAELQTAVDRRRERLTGKRASSLTF
jgi:DNA-binding transcriptional ArsR family regulator